MRNNVALLIAPLNPHTLTSITGLSACLLAYRPIVTSLILSKSNPTSTIVHSSGITTTISSVSFVMTVSGTTKFLLAFIVRCGSKAKFESSTDLPKAISLQKGSSVLCTKYQLAWLQDPSSTSSYR